VKPTLSSALHTETSTAVTTTVATTTAATTTAAANPVATLKNCAAMADTQVREHLFTIVGSGC